MALRTGVPAALGSPIALAAIALGGVFAASFVGAVISSAVFATIGAGFAGIAAAALKENARLQESFTALGRTVKGQLSAAASELVPAFDQALNTVRGMFAEHIQAPLRDIFAALAPMVVPFVESAVRTIGDVLDTLASPQVTEGLRTVFASMTAQLPRLGAAFSDFFRTTAGNADDTAEAFENITGVLSGLITFTGDAVRAMTDLFNTIATGFDTITIKSDPAAGFLSKVDQQLRSIGGNQEPIDIVDKFNANIDEGIPLIESLALALQANAMETKAATEETEGYSGATMTASERVDIFRDRQEKLRARLESTNEALSVEEDKLKQLKDTMFASAEGVLGLRDAQRDYQEQVDVTRETLKENGKTLDINTEKGRENQEAIDLQTLSALAQIEAMIEQGKSTEQVSKFTKQARTDFINAAVAAGMEKEEARKLARQLGLVPSEVETKMEAIDNATEEIERLKERIAEIERQINVTVRFTRIGDPRMFGRGHLEGHTGGKLTASGLKRMHIGGLMPNERIVIGQVGERILSRRQTDAFDQFMASMGRSAQRGGDGAAAPSGDTFHFHGVREDEIMARIERRQRMKAARR